MAVQKSEMEAWNVHNRFNDRCRVDTSLPVRVGWQKVDLSLETISAVCFEALVRRAYTATNGRVTGEALE